MGNDPRQQIIAGLAAAFPNAKIGAETVKMYVRGLSDLDLGELRVVASAFAADAQWFPSIRELRRAVFEARLAIGTIDDAWETVERYANEPRLSRCPECGGTGTVDGGEPVRLNRSVIDAITAPFLRDALEKIADSAELPTKLCPKCDGHGEVPNPRRPKLDAVMERALAHVGGATAITSTDVPEVIRAQFLKAYARGRDELIRGASFDSAGISAQLDPGAGRRELEPPR